jgi:hypothetical protein
MYLSNYTHAMPTTTYTPHHTLLQQSTVQLFLLCNHPHLHHRLLFCPLSHYLLNPIQLLQPLSPQTHPPLLSLCKHHFATKLKKIKGRSTRTNSHGKHIWGSDVIDDCNKQLFLLILFTIDPNGMLGPTVQNFLFRIPTEDDFPDSSYSKLLPPCQKSIDSTCGPKVLPLFLRKLTKVGTLNIPTLNLHIGLEQHTITLLHPKGGVNSFLGLSLQKHLQITSLILMIPSSPTLSFLHVHLRQF